MPGRWQFIADFDANHFSIVMATGIVSLACWLLHLIWAAQILLAINVGFFCLILACNALRTVFFPRRLFANLFDYATGFGFFASVAAICVLGGQFLVISNMPGVATSLLWTAMILRIGLTYAIFTNLTIKKSKPALTAGLHGGWLLAVVATQAVALLAASLSQTLTLDHEMVLFFSLILWLSGCMLYVWIISLIFYRYTFYAMGAADLTPPYWINMGAMAITTLAGATLISMAEHSPLLQTLLPFLKGVTLLSWATATWWIPLLIVLGVWRHIYHGVKVTYDSRYWSIVFPLGMYAACTHRLADIVGFSFLDSVALIFLYFALAAWLATTIGMTRSIFRYATLQNHR